MPYDTASSDSSQVPMSILFFAAEPDAEMVIAGDVVEGFDTARIGGEPSF